MPKAGGRYMNAVRRLLVAAFGGFLCKIESPGPMKTRPIQGRRQFATLETTTAWSIKGLAFLPGIALRRLQGTYRPLVLTGPG